MSRLIACLFVLLTAGQAPAAPPEGPMKTDPEPWNATPPGDPIKDPESWTFTGRGTGGFVQSVGKDGITLYRPAMDVLHLRHDPLTGDPLGVTKKDTLPAWPAKTFLLGEELAKGEYIKTASPPDTYRITDVRVGDWVCIKYDRRNGVDICRTICIHRRPNGRVPPAPGEKPDEFRKYHEGANASQDWEENRLPYPRKYWPSYMGKDGKIYEGPYPSESIQMVPIPPAPPARAQRGQ
jgi:hypothetical protein